MNSPIRIQSIDHVVLRVNDLDAMLQFYCGVLGCQVERRQEELGLIQLRAGDALIDLVPVHGKLGRIGGLAPGREGRNLDHYCLRIERIDLAVLRTWLQRNGIDAGNPIIRYGAQGEGDSVYVCDPEGNVVELKPALS